jgi:hypothetical protein
LTQIKQFRDFKSKCMYEYVRMYFTLHFHSRLQAKNVLIKGGEWKLGIDDEPLPFQIVQVKHILRHPFYTAGNFKYDVAVLVLTENLRLAKNIYPICLPGKTDTLDAFYNGAGECIVTGWGKQVLQGKIFLFNSPCQDLGPVAGLSYVVLN